MSRVPKVAGVHAYLMSTTLMEMRTQLKKMLTMMYFQCWVKPELCIHLNVSVTHEFILRVQLLYFHFIRNLTFSTPTLFLVSFFS